MSVCITGWFGIVIKTGLSKNLHLCKWQWIYWNIIFDIQAIRVKDDGIY